MTEAPLVEIPGYRITAQIHEGLASTLYRAVRRSDSLPVVLKVLKPSHASAAAIAGYHHELETSRCTNDGHVIAVHGIEAFEQTVFLVLEDFGGESLAELLPSLGAAGGDRFALDEFLGMARQVVMGLAALHAAGIVHRDMSPSNVLVNRARGQVKITGLENAAMLGRVSPREQNPRTLAAALSRAAPELTGRLNRSVDYRADFYSLGAVLYELVTGRLPFESNDPLELVHSHLARTPTAPSLVNPGTPAGVSDIIMKLLSKAPEERYQGAAGLLHDLDECSRLWHAERRIPSFSLGTMDRAEQFLIPVKVYGRSSEVTAVSDAFERAAAGLAELVVVWGPGGVGKTAVVNEVHGPVVRRHGYFVRGKFDRINQGAPMSAFVQAVRDLLGQVSAESDARVRRLRAAILASLGDSAGVLTEMFPELTLIIGPQPPVPDLPAGAAENRFSYLVQNFLRVFCRADHPVVMFLDDIQWADAASLKLVRLLMDSSRAAHFLLIGACREDDVPAGHPLHATLADVARAGTRISRIVLGPLGEQEITRMIADTLGCPAERAYPLAALVCQETRGNPFFSTQFLKALHDEGLITYNPEVGSWECDLAAVGARARTDDVVEFMALRLKKLPRSARRLLELAACIGNAFDLETLALVSERPQEEVLADIGPALASGLVLPAGSAYRFYRAPGGPDVPREEAMRPLAYRFLHDHAQHAAYLLIPPEETAETHLRIGRFLSGSASDASRQEKLFEIVSHLNKGITLVSEPSARTELAELNLLAGRKARASAAYRAAGEYFAIGRRLLPEDAWEAAYPIALELHVSSAEAAYLNGEFELMDSLARTVLERARTLPETVRVYEVRIESLSGRNRMREAVSLGLQVLRTLGVTFPPDPGPEDFRTALQETTASYGGGNVERLIELPPMTDPLLVSTMRLLVSISAAAFLSAPALYSLLILEQVRMSVQHGNLPASAFCYASYGLLLCSAAGRIDEGHAFGALALRLLSLLKAREWQCKVTAIVASFITHWKDHVCASLEPLRAAHYVGLETGDFQFAAYSAVLYVAYAYFAGTGKSLPDLQAEMQILSDTTLRTGQITVHQYFRMLQQAVHELIDGRDSSHPLEGTLYSEQALMPSHREAKDRNGIFYVHFHKLILHFLSAEEGAAVQDAALVEEFSDGGTGFPYLPIACFFDSLARIARFRASHGETVEELNSRIDANQERLHMWARHAPVNHLHRISLVEAERHRTFGRKLEALEEYDRAIAGARATSHLRDEAIASELAAEFYADWGRETIAGAYLGAAVECYQRWGAAAKVRALRRRLPLLRPHEPPAAEPGREPSADGALAPVSSLVDVALVIKASQAIAREIDLPRLISQLLRIAMENAGAQHGALVLDRDGEWVVVAIGDAETRDVTLLDSVELRGAEGVSADIVLAAVHSGAGIVLGDAAAEGDFVNDRRVAAHGVRSVMCTPLVNQGRVTGLLYLENNLARNSFAASHRELLRMLSTQMALSLDNALLYQKAQKEIAERRLAEAALRESEDRFHAIYDSVNDAVLVQDMHTGVIIDVNATMCSMYGYPRHEALALRVADLSLDEAPYTEVEAQAWLRAAASGDPQMFEWKARDKAGRVFWVEVNMRRASLGGTDRILVVVREITGRKQAEEQIRLLNEELENRVQRRTAELAQANQELESFSYSVSHDLRSPLRAIDGYARILEEEHGGALDGEGRRVCAVIRSNAARMDHLINDLLSFSRLGRMELRSTAIDMNELVRSVLEELTQLPGNKGPEVRVAELPPASGDAAVMRQVWMNLLSNALKFSSKQARMRVEVTARVDSSEVVYTVRDNGVGFDMAYAAKLFGVFQRLHAETEFPGTGVGLAIVKRGVQRHGGRVWAEGRPGAGAAFFFALPRGSEGAPR